MTQTTWTCSTVFLAEDRNVCDATQVHSHSLGKRLREMGLWLELSRSVLWVAALTCLTLRRSSASLGELLRVDGQSFKSKRKEALASYQN